MKIISRVILELGPNNQAVIEVNEKESGERVLKLNNQILVCELNCDNVMQLSENLLMGLYRGAK